MKTALQPVIRKNEFGDFQTPLDLARLVTTLLDANGIIPSAVIEPTCGKGAFLKASLETFPNAQILFGLDINEDYIEELNQAVCSEKLTSVCCDFFNFDWVSLVDSFPDHLLIIGNPPWITSSDLSAIGSGNHPKKQNLFKLKGVDAITGKSNFDISEWMLLQYMDWLEGRDATWAVLCKTAVARKILKSLWKSNSQIDTSRIYKINAQEHFGASVDACLFVVNFKPQSASKDCEIYESITDDQISQVIGYHDGTVVSDVKKYKKWSFLRGENPDYIWRSGVKHDCSKVLELVRTESGYKNGFGEQIDIEETHLFPLFKSSDIGNGTLRYKDKFVIITQSYVGEDTIYIEKTAPKTWEYLHKYRGLLDSRGSSIYRNKPDFSIFGIGQYTFSEWKIAVSGLYKGLNFKKVGPMQGKISVFDDTVNILSTSSEKEADFLLELLLSEPAQSFLGSMIFWSDKRPITIELLKRLDLKKLAEVLNLGNEYTELLRNKSTVSKIKHSYLQKI